MVSEVKESYTPPKDVSSSSSSLPKRRLRESVRPCFDPDNEAHRKYLDFDHVEDEQSPVTSDSPSTDPPTGSVSVSSSGSNCDTLGRTSLGISKPIRDVQMHDYSQWLKTPELFLKSYADALYDDFSCVHHHLKKLVSKPFYDNVASELASLVTKYPYESREALVKRLALYVSDSIWSEISQSISTSQIHLKGLGEFLYFARRECRDVFMLNASVITFRQKELTNLEDEMILKAFKQRFETYFSRGRLYKFCVPLVVDFVGKAQQCIASHVVDVRSFGNEKHRNVIPIPRLIGKDDVYDPKAKCLRESISLTNNQSASSDPEISIKLDQDCVSLDKLVDGPVVVNGCVTIRAPVTRPHFTNADDEGSDVDLVIIFEIPQLETESVEDHIVNALQFCFHAAKAANIFIAFFNDFGGNVIASKVREVCEQFTDENFCICNNSLEAAIAGGTWMSREGARKYKHLFLVSSLAQGMREVRFEELGYGEDVTASVFIPQKFASMQAENWSYSFSFLYGGQMHNFQSWDDLKNVFQIAISQEIIGIAHRHVRISLDGLQKQIENVILRHKNSNDSKLSIDVGNVDVLLQTTDLRERSSPFKPYNCSLDDRTVELTNLAYGSKRDVMFRIVLTYHKKCDVHKSAGCLTKEKVPASISATPPLDVVVTSDTKNPDDLDNCMYCFEEGIPRMLRCNRMGSTCKFAMCSDCSTEENFELLHANGHTKCFNCNMTAEMWKSEGICSGDDISLKVPCRVAESKMLAKGNVGKVVDTQKGNLVTIQFSAGCSSRSDDSIVLNQVKDQVSVLDDISILLEDRFADELQDFGSTLAYQNQIGIQEKNIIEISAKVRQHENYGLVFYSASDLKLLRVQEGIFQKTMLKNYVDWRLVKINNYPVETLSDIEWHKQFLRDGEDITLTLVHDDDYVPMLRYCKEPPLFPRVLKARVRSDNEKSIVFEDKTGLKMMMVQENCIFTNVPDFVGCRISKINQYTTAQLSDVLLAKEFLHQEQLVRLVLEEDSAFPSGEPVSSYDQPPSYLWGEHLSSPTTVNTKVAPSTPKIKNQKTSQQVQEEKRETSISSSTGFISTQRGFGIQYQSESDLTITGVDEDSIFPWAKNFDGWRITKVDKTDVRDHHDLERAKESLVSGDIVKLTLEMNIPEYSSIAPRQFHKVNVARGNILDSKKIEYHNISQQVPQGKRETSIFSSKGFISAQHCFGIQCQSESDLTITGVDAYSIFPWAKNFDGWRITKVGETDVGDHHDLERAEASLVSGEIVKLTLEMNTPEYPNNEPSHKVNIAHGVTLDSLPFKFEPAESTCHGDVKFPGEIILPETLVSKTVVELPDLQKGDIVVVISGRHQGTRGSFMFHHFPKSGARFDLYDICSIRTFSDDGESRDITVALQSLRKVCDEERHWLGKRLSFQVQVSFSDGHNKTRRTVSKSIPMTKEGVIFVTQANEPDALYVKCHSFCLCKAQMIRSECCTYILKRQRFAPSRDYFHGQSDYGKLPSIWVAAAEFLSRYHRQLQRLRDGNEIKNEMEAIYKSIINLCDRQKWSILRPVEHHDDFLDIIYGEENDNEWRLNLYQREGPAIAGYWEIARSLHLQRSSLALPKKVYEPSAISSGTVPFDRTDIIDPYDNYKHWWFSEHFPMGRQRQLLGLFGGQQGAGLFGGQQGAGLFGGQQGAGLFG